MDIKAYMETLGKQARQAARTLVSASTEQKNHALLAMADMIVNSAEALKAENAKDLENGKNKGLDAAMLDRLALTDAGIAGIAIPLKN